MPRDRRWDFLYDRQKQPVRTYIVEKFAEELARGLERERPPDAVLRAGLEAARLDLDREWERAEAALDALEPVERTQARELARALVEECLALKERAAEAKLARGDLCDALRLAEGRLFRIVLG